MRVRWLFLIGAPLGFGYFLREAAAAANTVDLDLFSAFVYLLMAIPMGLAGAAAYGSLIGNWIGEQVWLRFSESPGHDHPHWLVAATAWLERTGLRLPLRWLCFVAVQFRYYSEWSVLHKRGLGAARKGSWLERFFAGHLYRFSHALDALRSAEVLVSHGIQPPAHPDPQVKLFILRAGLSERPPGKQRVVQSPGKMAEPAESLLPNNFDPASNPLPVGSAAMLRNPEIVLFEGAEQKNVQWNSQASMRADSTKAPATDRRETTVFFSPPIPPALPFQAVRLRRA
jgi:hypothetical protein